MAARRWAALLRGVNVGGNRKLPMADLRAFVEVLGFARVETLLASGNVVFDADEGDGEKLEKRLEREAEVRLGLKTDFLLRDASELNAAIEANPFSVAAKERPSTLVIIFAREDLPRDLPVRLAPIYDGPETIAVAGRHLYVDYPDGQGRSKLGPALARLKLPRTVTARNWNTVRKLAAMLAR